MAQARIPEQTMMNYFQKLFIASLHAIANSDRQFLDEYLESRFAEKVMESNEKLGAKGLFLEVKSDLKEDGLFVSTFCEVVDGILVKGLTSDRRANGAPEDFHLWSDLDDMGIAVYTHKKYSDPENFIDPEANKRVYDDFEVVLVRLLLSIKTPYVLNIMKRETPEKEGPSYDFEDQEAADQNQDFDIYGTKRTSGASVSPNPKRRATSTSRAPTGSSGRSTRSWCST